MPTDYQEDRRYFTRLADAEVTYCLKCAGHTLTASIESGGHPGVVPDEFDPTVLTPATIYDGISGQQFFELTPAERRTWRDTNLQFDNDPWVCEHEMLESLTTRVC